MTQDLILDINVSGLQDVTDDIERFPQSVSRELTVAMEAALQLLEGQVKARTPVNTDKLAGSINHQIISPFPNLIGSVGAPGPYALVIEKGRRPGARRPPVDAIRMWVVRKLGLAGDEADSAAEAIAWHIHHHGFSAKGDVGPRGARMFEEGLKTSEPHINTLFESAIARSVQRFNQS